ncbi:MAG: hypothetical protein M3R23_07340, partial [Actinomycetota bacterium]|nr:hypothetical protein [Actinomycetota bacterium]
LRSPPSAGGGEVAVADRAQGSSTAASATSVTGPAAGKSVVSAARAAIFACFLALIAHTMAYAGFLEDPLTWVLLSIGGSLAVAPQLAMEQAEADRGREVPAGSPAQAPA